MTHVSRCEHCRGLMVLDSFDPDAQTCLNCGRCSFQPSPEVLAEEPQPATPDPVGHLVPRAVPRAPRSRRVRDTGPRQGGVNVVIRRFS